MKLSRNQHHYLRIIRHMGSEIACWPGRLRSAREKKRFVKLDFTKQLLRLERERRLLREQQRQLGFEPLVPPVQKGYKRLFVLRDEVARSPRAEFFCGILDKINTVQYSDTREFSRKKRHRGRKIRVACTQELRPVYAHEWQRFDFTPAQAFYFTETMELSAGREWRKVYRFVEPWRFRLQIVPNLSTRVRIKDTGLEKRLHEINDYLERNFLERKLQRLLYGHCGSYYAGVKIKEAHPFQNKPLPRILEMARQEACMEAE
jgi:hypothetical protein